MNLNEEIKKVGNKWVVYPKKPKAGQKKRKPLGIHNTKEEAVAQLRAIEISKMKHKNESKLLSFDEYLYETQNPANYEAPEGSARDKKLDKAKKLLKGDKEDKEKAYKLRDKMEANVRNKPGWKNTPREDSKAAKNKVNEKELQLGIRYTYSKTGEEGFISTGGSSDSDDWKFLGDKTYPYKQVKKYLKSSIDQSKKGFGDYLSSGGREWD